MTNISFVSHPFLFHAITLVAFDNGENPPVEFTASKSEEDCSKANAILSTLHPYDQESLAIGEETDQLALRSLDPGLEIAWDILNEFFEGLCK